MHGTGVHPDVEGIAHRLRSTYGELLLLREAAKELRKSPATVKVTLGSSRRRDRYPWSRRLAAARVRMGRRVYFSADGVAAVIAYGDALDPEVGE